MGFEGFLVNLRFQTDAVAVPPRVYIVFYHYKLAFANMIADLYLCKLCVWCGLNANIAAAARTPARDPDEHCEIIYM